MYGGHNGPGTQLKDYIIAHTVISAWLILV